MAIPAAKILHVEDDEELREHTRIVLTKLAGYTVCQAANVAQARRELADQQFDLVICDGWLVKRSLFPNAPAEGADLAAELVNAGKNAIIVSSDDEAKRPGVPFVHKDNWGDPSHMCEIVAQALNSSANH